MEKKNLLVSFSGGETSAFMAWWLWNHKQNEFNMVFCFANTGQENYETIQFIRKFETHFKIKIHYIEALVHHGERKANTHKIVEPWNLDMEGKVFEEVIQKHGIPNNNFPHCSRELKKYPIKSFAKEYFKGEEYFTAIGIRNDEWDRMSANRVKEKLIYPLISQDFIQMTKPKINFWWANQPFRLELKGYEGNCVTCWKKSDKKLFKIAQEKPFALNFMDKMESKYGQFTPNSRLKLMSERGEEPKYPIVFFRGNRSAHDMFMESKQFKGQITDDSLEEDEDISCDIYAECGIDN